MGRTKKHADENARNQAYRDTVRRLDIAVTPSLMTTLDKLAGHFQVSKSDLVNSLIRDALTNRDILKTGLYQWR
jgi:hypothetical protein